eukprot:6194313-Pleurochrysis_carterae.AAC.2
MLRDWRCCALNFRAPGCWCLVKADHVRSCSFARTETILCIEMTAKGMRTHNGIAHAGTQCDRSESACLQASGVHMLPHISALPHIMRIYANFCARVCK